MFRRLNDSSSTVTILVDGVRLPAVLGETVSNAMLCAGVVAFRKTPVSDAPRSVYCDMGVCFDCLVTIDGRAGQQSCLTVVRDGMNIITGRGLRDLSQEAL